MDPSYHRPSNDYSLGIIYDRPVHPEYREQQNHRGTAYVSWYLRKGSVQVKSRQETIRARSGDWIFIDALTTRSHQFSVDASVLSIRHRVNWRGLQFIPPHRPPIVYRGPMTEELVQAATSLLRFRQDHPDFAASVTASLISLGTARLHNWLYFWHKVREASIEQKSELNDPRVYTIMAQLSDHTSIRPIPYKQLSTHIGLSKAQIDRIFKAELGITPKQWQEAQCLQAAEDWLASGSYTSKEIAAKLDFYDASHFSRWFSQQSGLAPGKWKQNQIASA